MNLKFETKAGRLYKYIKEDNGITKTFFIVVSPRKAISGDSTTAQDLIDGLEN